MELISTTTVGVGGASSITFSSIPATYTDLVLVYSLRSGYASEIAGLAIGFNSDSTTGNYTWRTLYGYGTGAGSTTSSFNKIGNMVGANATANTFSNGAITIPNYANSSTKIATNDDVTENNGTVAYQDLIALQWNNTAIVNSITLLGYNSDTIQQYSTASLYGILKGSGGASVA